MSLAFRAFFALPDTLSTSTGEVTNALNGFVSMVAYIVKDHQPRALAVAFDLPGRPSATTWSRATRGGGPRPPMRCRPSSR